jgi:hypothetical protein
MKRVLHFTECFKSLGGNLSNLDPKDIHDELNKIELKVSSFKHQAEEIKRNYNYKF